MSIDNLIKKWKRIQDYIKEKQSHLKKYTSKKKEIEQKLIEYNKKKSIHSEFISIEKKQTKEPLNNKTIEKYLTLFTKTQKNLSPNFSSNFIKFMDAKRELKTIYKIKNNS